MITSMQAFIMLFVSQILLNLTYNPLMSAQNNMWDNTISTIVSFLLVFLSLIPIYLLYKPDENNNLIKKFTIYFGKTGIIISLIYALYYLFANCYSLCVFNIFIANVMSPNTSLWTVSLAVGLTSWYGASKGIEGLARASFIIFFMIIASIIFLFCALVPRIDKLNYTPIEGMNNVVSGTINMISQNFCMAAIVTMLPFVKGNIKNSIFFWNFLSHLFLVLIIFLTVGSLGDYLKTQMFPVYTAATIAEIGALKRLDSIFLGLWTTSLFCKISLFNFLISNIFKEIFSKKVAKNALMFSSIFLIIFATISSYNFEFLKFLYNSNFVFCFTILVTVILPCFLLCFKRTKKV